MITTTYVQTMAGYGRWQNVSVFQAADTLADAERKQDRRAFFGSIHATLNHLLWGDTIWMSRFTDLPGPRVGSIGESVAMIEHWDELKRERQHTDAAIIDWALTLKQAQLDGDLTYYSGAAGREITKPLALLIVHMFNHQTHHRGQISAMLTAAGAKTGDTDMPLMPAEFAVAAP